MVSKKQAVYSLEFKESSVKLAISTQQPINQTARELGINANTLYGWISKYSRPVGLVTRTSDHIYDEVKRLKKDLARITQERDILKKAAAYFARESL